jgi:hypothetical protein
MAEFSFQDGARLLSGRFAMPLFTARHSLPIPYCLLVSNCLPLRYWTIMLNFAIIFTAVVAPMVSLVLRAVAVTVTAATTVLSGGIGVTGQHFVTYQVLAYI